LIPGNGVAHEDLTLPGVEDEDAPVAAPEERAVVGVGVGAAIVDPHGEPAVGYAVGRIQDRGERDPSLLCLPPLPETILSLFIHRSLAAISYRESIQRMHEFIAFNLITMTK
jgi:hypothetical protein